jgi:hypothetical protein
VAKESRKASRSTTRRLPAMVPVATATQ